jgi:aspartyl protease family protein
MPRDDSLAVGRKGGPVIWACRQVAIWGGVAFGFYLVVMFYGPRAAPRPQAAAMPPAAMPAAAPAGAIHNTLVFQANARGQVELDGAVNAAPVHFIVDTGATMVTLTMADAAAAGFGSSDLNFTLGMSTANGRVAAAPVTLREVRIGQLELDDVPAAVVPNLPVSLLGMSFLSRLDRWDMRGGTLTISY